MNRSTLRDTAAHPARVAAARSVLLLAALLLSSCQGYPAGRGEQGPLSEDEIQVWWVLRGEEANSGILVERMFLPTSLAAFAWNNFSLTGEGVQLDSQGGYRVVSRRQTQREAVGELVVQTEELSIRVASAAPHPAGRPRTYDVDFSYAGLKAATSRVIPQPLQEALLRGIRSSGRGSGQARVLSLRYLGAGRFAATVQVL
jgi:hypothetical protein